MSVIEPTTHPHQPGEPTLECFANALSIDSYDPTRITSLPSEDVVNGGKATFYNLLEGTETNVRLGFLEVAAGGSFTLVDRSLPRVSLSSGGTVMVLIEGSVHHGEEIQEPPASIVLSKGALANGLQPSFTPGSIVLVAHFGPSQRETRESYAINLSLFVQFSADESRLSLSDSGSGYRQHLLSGNSDAVWMGLCKNPDGRVTEVAGGDPGGQSNLFLPRDGVVVAAQETHPTTGEETALTPGTLLLEGPGAPRKIEYPKPTGDGEISPLAVHIAFL